MRMKWVAQVLALSALGVVTAMCARDDLDDKTDDVIEAQEEAARVAEENPQDTAAIRDAGEEVIDEQREAADALRKEVRDRGLDTIPTTTRE